MGEERAERATYQDVMEYVAYLRKGFSNPVTINRMLYAVKAWYFYLITTGKRGDHPCRMLKLKDARIGDVQLHDLFTSIELEKLMHRKERYKIAAQRGQGSSDGTGLCRA